MNEKDNLHKEDIALVAAITSKARQTAADNAFHALLWGMLLIITSVLQYILAWNDTYIEYEKMWAALVIVGLPISLIREWKKRKKGKHPGYAGWFAGVMWIGLVISLIILIFISNYHFLNPVPLLLLFFGLATFITGTTSRFSPLVAGGIIFWLSAIAATFVTGSGIWLLNALAIFVAYIIPGSLLRRKVKREPETRL